MQTIQQFAKQVRDEAFRPVTIKVGRTNGQPLLHVVDSGVDGREASTNVRDEGEWRNHPAHYLNKPSKRRESNPDSHSEAA